MGNNQNECDWATSLHFMETAIANYLNQLNDYESTFEPVIKTTAHQSVQQMSKHHELPHNTMNRLLQVAEHEVDQALQLLTLQEKTWSQWIAMYTLWNNNNDKVHEPETR
jgi:hypothetical protein